MKVLDVNNKEVVLDIPDGGTTEKLIRLVNGYNNAISDVADIILARRNCSVSCEPEPNIDFIKRNLMEALAPNPAPKPARPAPGKFRIDGYDTQIYYGDGVGANARVILVNDLESSIPVAKAAPACVPTPLPTVQPMPLNMEMITTEYTYGQLVSVGWRDEQMVDVGFAKYIAPVQAPTPEPVPFWLDEDRSIAPMWDGVRKQWMTPFSNLDLVFSCLKRDSLPAMPEPTPMAPESHVLYPMVDGKQERITSKSINGVAMFFGDDVLKCFEAWEHTDLPVYSALNKLRGVLDVRCINYVGTIELAIESLEVMKEFDANCDKGFDEHFAIYEKLATDNGVTHAVKTLVRQLRKVNRGNDKKRTELRDVEDAVDAARKVFKIDLSLTNAGVVNKMRSMLTFSQKSVSDLTDHINGDDEQAQPGVVTRGEQAVVESLADQWSKVYKLVHSSAGGTCDNATEAAHNFIEIIK